ncbi:MAG: AAA family ATPase [Candidatus Gracilibacteria bacterium]
MKIDLNPEFQHALDLMESGKNVFVTGRAGTGKSTLLSYFRTQTKRKTIVLAPTGVAAINVQGQTIHSFFGFKPDITPHSVLKKLKKNKKNIYKKIETLVIDEISMVRADLLDCVDLFLQLHGPRKGHPFGGVQMIFIGDLYQLPPVVSSRERSIFTTHYESPYFFSAKGFADFKPEFIELEKVYRQKDDEFIRLLNTVRNRTATSEDLGKFNTRHDPDFQAPIKDFYIYLTSTNALADTINQERLARLPGKLRTVYGEKEGDFGREYFPTAEALQFKVGAQIMMLNNEATGRWVNGTIGKITRIKKSEDDEAVIEAELQNGKTVEITPHTWEIFNFSLNGENQLDSKIVGTFTQYPFRLAFAITIHKAQGKTFEKVIVDVGSGTFAHGQMYVALSRCTSLEGLVLKKAIKPNDIQMDYQVVKFLTRYQYSIASEKCTPKDRMTLIQRAIRDKKNLKMTYLKAKDEKSTRTVKPLAVGEREYKGISFIGMEAYCLLRKGHRVFNVDRILEMEVE